MAKFVKINKTGESENQTQINEIGVEPTNEVILSEEYYRNPSMETDNQLQEALTLLTK